MDSRYRNMERLCLKQSSGLLRAARWRYDNVSYATLNPTNVGCFKNTEEGGGILKASSEGKPSNFPQSSGRLYERRAKITERKLCRSRNTEAVRAQHRGKNELRSYSSREDVVLLV